MPKNEAIRRLICRSGAVQRVLNQLEQIEQELRARMRQVWPMGTAAKLLGVTPSLFRKWISQGVLSRYRPPTKYHRPGITERAIREFLRQLADLAPLGLIFGGEWDSEFSSSGARGALALVTARVRPAEERCREALRGLPAGTALSPAEFAGQAGVSVTTVHRLLAWNALSAWYPTPHRPKIGLWSEKERRIFLTRKRAKSGRKAA